MPLKLIIMTECPPGSPAMPLIGHLREGLNVFASKVADIPFHSRESAMWCDEN
jgi:hypothetical protein